MLPFSGNCGLLCYLYSPGVGTRGTAWTWKLESCFPKSLLALHHVDPMYQTQLPCWATVPPAALLAPLLQSKCFFIFMREWTKSKRVCRNQGQVIHWGNGQGNQDPGAADLQGTYSRPGQTESSGSKATRKHQRPNYPRHREKERDAGKSASLLWCHFLTELHLHHLFDAPAWPLRLEPLPSRTCLSSSSTVFYGLPPETSGEHLCPVCSLMCPQQQKQC